MMPKSDTAAANEAQADEGVTATTPDVPVELDKLVKVRVPADVGDSVTLSNGLESRTFSVVDGVISPKSKADAAELLSIIPGATAVD